MRFYKRDRRERYLDGPFLQFFNCDVDETCPLGFDLANSVIETFHITHTIASLSDANDSSHPGALIIA